MQRVGTLPNHMSQVRPTTNPQYQGFEPQAGSMSGPISSSQPTRLDIGRTTQGSRAVSDRSTRPHPRMRPLVQVQNTRVTRTCLTPADGVEQANEHAIAQAVNWWCGAALLHCVERTARDPDELTERGNRYPWIAAKQSTERVSVGQQFEIVVIRDMQANTAPQSLSVRLLRGVSHLPHRPCQLLRRRCGEGVFGAPGVAGGAYFSRQDRALQRRATKPTADECFRDGKL